MADLGGNSYITVNSVTQLAYGTLTTFGSDGYIQIDTLSYVRNGITVNDAAKIVEFRRLAPGVRMTLLCESRHGNL